MCQLDVNTAGIVIKDLLPVVMMADKTNNIGRIGFQREVSKKQRALFDSACPAGTVQDCLKTSKGFTHSKRTSTVVK